MEPATPAKAEEPEPEPKTPEETVVLSTKSSLDLIERSVATKEPRFFSRAMRQTAGARKKMSLAAATAVLGCLPESELKQLCLDRVKAAPAADAGAMDVDGAAATPAGELDVSELKVAGVECEVYLFIVAVQFLLDKKQTDAAFEVSSSVLAYCDQQGDRRSMDTLLAQVWYYHSLICERKDTLPSIRTRLLAAHRSSVLNRDEPGQAMYLNLLLRNYLTPTKSGSVSVQRNSGARS